MFETSDDTKARRPRRVEVFTGPERRRDWPDERKVAIVAESLSPGINASALARSHDINPQQLFGWRRRFRAEAEVLIASTRARPAPLCFAPVHVEPPTASPSEPPLSSVDNAIEIVIGSATVRIRGTADLKTLALVFKALKVLL